MPVCSLGVAHQRQAHHVVEALPDVVRQPGPLHAKISHGPLHVLCGSSLHKLADQPRRLQLLHRPMHRNPHVWPKQPLDGEALLALLEAVF